MDIFSHGLWAGAGAALVNRKLHAPKTRKLSIRKTVFWGVAPDLFSFGLAFAWLALRWTTGSSDQFFPHDPAHPELQFGTGDPASTVVPLAWLTAVLYQFTHSAVIFFGVFGLILLFRSIRRKRLLSFSAVPLEMFGWLFHILIDIPTHSYRFYPTPFLWPLSAWKFNGFSWGTPWFLALNYFLLVAAYVWLLRGQKRKGGNS